MFPHMELARQNRRVLHDLAQHRASFDPRYVMGYVLGVEDEEDVDLLPLVGEQLLRPIDEVDAEVFAVRGAGFNLRCQRVLAQVIRPVLVRREVGHGEELGPLEAAALE